VSEIDPDFMGEIENSLFAMWDYANNQPASSPEMQIIRNADLKRAEAILDRIAEWFDK
jgi:hypothetical protein